MTDPVPGFTVYAITMAQAREIPGPQQDIGALRQRFWLPVVGRTNPLADLITRHRRGMKITQAELSRRIGANNGYIGSLESGSFIRPFEYALPIAKALDIPVTAVLEAGAQAIAQQREALSEAA